MLRLTLLFALLPVFAGAAEPLTVAVASNFLRAADELTQEFTATTGVAVRISAGSTGKLYAQIRNGAPYDVFLSADVARPRKLVEEGLALAESRFTYAQGTLVLWSAEKHLRNRDCVEVFESGHYRHLAIANPQTAPYGRAAKQYLIAAGHWSNALHRLVLGENISQAMQFVVTRNATFGLLALSQVKGELSSRATCFWPIPAEHYAPINQQGVILQRSEQPQSARAFLDFMQSERAVEILVSHGYTVP